MSGLFAAFVDTLRLAEPLAARIRRSFASPRRLREALERAADGRPTLAVAPAGERLAALLSGLPEDEATAVLEDLGRLAGIEPAGGRSAGEIVHRRGRTRRRGPVARPRPPIRRP